MFLPRSRYLNSYGRMPLAGGALALSVVLWSCAPEFDETPFSCTDGGSCPDGYTCRSTVCVQDGVELNQTRPMRVSWINSAEMYWFASPSDGATLVVNDGFTAGSRGLYELRVAPDGEVRGPELLLKLGDEYPTASSVIALNSSRYAVVLFEFPSVTSDSYRLKVLGLEREVAGTKSLNAETLYTQELPFVGGAEPAYVGAVGGGERIDFAYTQPSDGGAVVLTRLERQGAVWEATRTLSLPLPPDVLPLSGDCYLWDLGEGRLALRVGFDSFEVAVIEDDGTATDFVPSEGLPLHVWNDGSLVMNYDDENDFGYDVSFVLQDPDGATVDRDTGYVLQAALEPHVALAYGEGAIVAPLSTDADFAALSVGYRTPTSGLEVIATIARNSVEELYSTRAFVHDGVVYLAWTQFHEALMDLWVATQDAKGLP